MRSVEIEEWLTQNRTRIREGGITAVDLLDLPAALSPILRVLFVRGPLTRQQIRFALHDETNETAQGESTDLDEALQALCEQRWLIRSEPEGSGDGPLYRINLRTKARMSGASDRWEVLDFER
jgi:hypothetical protein